MFSWTVKDCQKTYLLLRLTRNHSLYEFCDVLDEFVYGQKVRSTTTDYMTVRTLMYTSVLQYPCILIFNDGFHQLVVISGAVCPGEDGVSRD